MAVNIIKHVENYLSKGKVNHHLTNYLKDTCFGVLQSNETLEVINAGVRVVLPLKKDRVESIPCDCKYPWYPDFYLSIVGGQNQFYFYRHSNIYVYFETNLEKMTALFQSVCPEGWRVEITDKSVDQGYSDKVWILTVSQPITSWTVSATVDSYHRILANVDDVDGFEEKIVNFKRSFDTVQKAKQELLYRLHLRFGDYNNSLENNA